MSDVNNSMKSVSSLSKSIEKDLGELLKVYAGLSDTIKAKLREEVAYNDSFEGLETFSALNNTVKRNLGSVRSSFQLIKKLRDLSVFNVSEIEEEIINGDITKLMKK